MSLRHPQEEVRAKQEEARLEHEAALAEQKVRCACRAMEGHHKSS
jgi:hypothetical protein